MVTALDKFTVLIFNRTKVNFRVKFKIKPSVMSKSHKGFCQGTRIHDENTVLAGVIHAGGATGHWRPPDS